MSKPQSANQVRMIPIDRINILNPRERNKKVFRDITMNITQVGLKRPITVTASKSDILDKDYDLICGQGRMEAFIACGQKEIPAIVVEASQEQALIMSLVENLARRKHRAVDLMQGIEILQRQGHSAKEIAAKTGLSLDYATDLMNLLERGEERLISAVESGQVPITIAVKIAESDGNEQLALQEIYESKQLRGDRFLAAKKLIEQRRRGGKTLTKVSRASAPREISAQENLKTYHREIERKRVIAHKAEVTNNTLTFIAEALRLLFKDQSFKDLLRNEGLNTLPKPLSEFLAENGII